MRFFVGFFLALIISVSMVGLFSEPAMAQTASARNCQNRARGGMSFLVDFPTWYKYLELDSNCEIEDFEVPGDIWKIALAIIEILLRVAGMVATGYVVWAGFKYVMSRGNPSEASKARQTIIDALIGVGIASISIVLVAFLGRTLVQ